MADLAIGRRASQGTGRRDAFGGGKGRRETTPSLHPRTYFALATILLTAASVAVASLRLPSVHCASAWSRSSFAFSVSSSLMVLASILFCTASSAAASCWVH